MPQAGLASTAKTLATMLDREVEVAASVLATLAIYSQAAAEDAAEELRQAAQRRELLPAELSHRVKNALAATASPDPSWRSGSRPGAWT